VAKQNKSKTSQSAAISKRANKQQTANTGGRLLDVRALAQASRLGDKS
jgi:hypothetical protein